MKKECECSLHGRHTWEGVGLDGFFSILVQCNSCGALYRVLVNDSDGDPLDYGVVRADTEKEAQEYIAERLKEVCGPDDEDNDPDPLPVKLFELIEADYGVLDDRGPSIFSL